jgi:hypothetical protein
VAESLNVMFNCLIFAVLGGIFASVRGALVLLHVPGSSGGGGGV